MIAGRKTSDKRNKEGERGVKREGMGATMKRIDIMREVNEVEQGGREKGRVSCGRGRRGKIWDLLFLDILYI